MKIVLYIVRCLTYYVYIRQAIKLERIMKTETLRNRIIELKNNLRNGTTTLDADVVELNTLIFIAKTQFEREFSTYYAAPESIAAHKSEWDWVKEFINS